MGNKINIGFSLHLALASIFTIFFILILNSNVFALTAPNTIEAKDIENIIDYIYSVQDDIQSSVTVEERKSTLDSIKQNVVYSNVANTWNTYINTTTMPYMENITITFKVDATYLYIYMTPSNNTIGDIAPFPKVKESYGDNYNSILLSYVNSNGESVSVNGNYIRIDKNGSIAQSNNYRPSTISTHLYENIEVDATNSTCQIPSILGLNTNTNIYFQQGDKSVFSWYINENKINTVNRVIPDIPEEPEEPEQPEQPEQPTTSGEYGSVLDNINSGIGDINNNIKDTNNKLEIISGELSDINSNLTTVPSLSGENISSGDIETALNFDFFEDPYTNFWLELTTGLSNAFTNSKREISIQFRDKTHIISLDNFSVQIPSALKPFLTIISTVFIIWKMLQYIKIIIDNISSGNIDEVLEMNEEEGITNLF